MYINIDTIFTNYLYRLKLILLTLTILLLEYLFLNWVIFCVIATEIWTRCLFLRVEVRYIPQTVHRFYACFRGM